MENKEHIAEKAQSLQLPTENEEQRAWKAEVANRQSGHTSVLECSIIISQLCVLATLSNTVNEHFQLI